MIITTEVVASRLKISPSRVNRLAAQYNIGTLLNRRMRVYTEEDVMEMQRYSTGVPGRPVRLSEALALAAAAAEERALASIRDGDSEAAGTDLRVAGHMRRLSQANAAGHDPIQVATPDE